jgi:hypothetical protein
MTLPNRPQNPQPNPVTQAAHKKQMTWQVYVPLIFCTAILITGAVFAASSGTQQAGKWASASVIFLILPTAAAGMVWLAITGLMIYGMARLLKIIPPFSAKAQNIFNLISLKTTELSNKTVKPVLGVNGLTAGARRIFRNSPKSQK